MKTKMAMKTLWTLSFVWLLAACGPKVVSDVSDIDPDLTFAVLKAAPDAQKGKKMIVGGEIIAVRNAKETTEIEVLAKPLASDMSPVQADVSLGRFILIEPSFLDPMIYKAGRRMTAVGKVAGGRIEKVGEAELTVPIFEEAKIHLWPTAYTPRPHDHWPDVHFGFGYHRGWW
jgi:outer membrane lipoprotein